MSARRVRVGVVGLGYWGPNLARNLTALEGCELAWLCDGDERRLADAGQRFGGARLGATLDELLADPELDAVVLATPVATHAELTSRVLEAGKDCFVEKPLARSVAQAQRVVELAQRGDRVLMVGHLLEYHPAVRALEALVADGELGRLRYIYGNRVNLGQMRVEENALWSLGAHDVSVVLALAGEEPAEVWARGECYMQPGIEDVVFAFMRFPSGLSAHLHLSWLDPHKERRITVVGDARMATFDDMAPERKLTVYDKGFDAQGAVRAGTTHHPPLEDAEPLLRECAHFVECVATRRRPRSDGLSGLRVVRVLEALQRELDATRSSARAGR